LQVLNQIISSKMETAAEVKMEGNAIDTSTAQKKNEPLAQQNDEQCEERKLLAAMLSLTVVICNKLMDKDDLNHVDIIDAELVQTYHREQQQRRSRLPGGCEACLSGGYSSYSGQTHLRRRLE
jgi:hypothetical protein